MHAVVREKDYVIASPFYGARRSSGSSLSLASRPGPLDERVGKMLRLAAKKLTAFLRSRSPQIVGVPLESLATKRALKISRGAIDREGDQLFACHVESGVRGWCATRLGTRAATGRKIPAHSGKATERPKCGRYGRTLAEDHGKRRRLWGLLATCRLLIHQPYPSLPLVTEPSALTELHEQKR
jgi:hypothetical protein